MLVSACIITYNHERYIKQTIENVLRQKTNFSLEIIIGNDHSTDNTLSICEYYKVKYPDKIKIIHHSSNVGMITNFIQTLKNCTGKYIALCEGDDYWTDPDKLQKQVDFLEQNPDFSMCSHDVEIIYEDDWPFENDKRFQEALKVSSFEDILEKHFIPTNSLVFRNGFIQKWPKWMYKMISGDIPLELMLAYHGKNYFMSEKMAVKRINGSGVTANPERQKKMIQFRADLYYHINHYTKYRYIKLLIPKIEKNSISILKNSILHYKFLKAVKYTWRIAITRLLFLIKKTQTA